MPRSVAEFKHMQVWGAAFATSVDYSNSDLLISLIMILRTVPVHERRAMRTSRCVERWDCLSQVTDPSALL